MKSADDSQKVIEEKQKYEKAIELRDKIANEANQPKTSKNTVCNFSDFRDFEKFVSIFCIHNQISTINVFQMIQTNPTNLKKVMTKKTNIRMVVELLPLQVVCLTITGRFRMTAKLY